MTASINDVFCVQLMVTFVCLSMHCRLKKIFWKVHWKFTACNVEFSEDRYGFINCKVVQY